MFVGANIAFFPMHFLGLAGMPRRMKLTPEAFETDSFPGWAECKKHYSPEFLAWLERFTEENKKIVAWAKGL